SAVRQQPLAKRWIPPRPGHHAGAVPWHPLLVDPPRVLVDEVGRLHSARLERRLQRRRALLHRGRGLLVLSIRHVSRSWGWDVSAPSGILPRDRGETQSGRRDRRVPWRSARSTRKTCTGCRSSTASCSSVTRPLAAVERRRDGSSSVTA